MSGTFGESIADVKRKEGVTLDVETLYEDVSIAMLTGWEFEYIDSLGLLRREGLLQVSDALEALKRPRKKR